MAKEGLIGGENENHEDDVLNRNANQINVGDEGDDVDVEMDHRPPNEDKRVALERKRRRIETQLYAELRDLLPNLPPKVYKSTILDEAMDSIKELKQTLHNLKEEKMKRLQNSSINTSMATPMPSQSLVANNESPLITEKGASTNLGTILYQSSNIFKTWASSNVTLSVCGTDAIINICSLKDPELFTKVCFILETHNMEIIYAQISSDHVKTMYMIRAHGIVPQELDNIGVPYEEMCKRAVAQIVQCVKF